MNHLENWHGFGTLIDDVYSFTSSVCWLICCKQGCKKKKKPKKLCDGFLTKLGQKMQNRPRRDPLKLMHIRMKVQIFQIVFLPLPDGAFLLISQQFINLDKKNLECAYGYLLRGA